MKKLVLALLLLVAIMALQAEMIDKIVAKVGTEIILLSDLQKQLAQMQSAKTLTENTDPLDVLNEMVDQRLMIQKAKEQNIKIDDNKIKNMAERYLKQIKSRYPSEQAFAADLKKSKLTESDLLKYYSEMLTESSLTEQLIERNISAKISVSDKELLAFYASTKDTLAVKPVSWDLGMIMREIKPGNSVRDEKLAQIKALLVRLGNGEDFATLAAEESDCPSKEVGGDLGFFSKGMMVKPFEDAAFALNLGEVSDVVETQFGYHIIKLEERKGNEIRTRHILKTLSASVADTLAEHALMEQIRVRFAANTSFADLAGEYSMDPESKADGGLLGEFSEADLPELFATQIMQTPLGELSPVLENEGMLYLFIRLKEHPVRVYTYEEVKAQIQQMIFRQKQMEAYKLWIDNLKRESYVQLSL
ncbi:MAG: peptidylprolyl isomerase [Candidatus Cloacimonas sp.]|jgi:peptidyl-prolyl cis-trans isomerase SurA|nr:peptidylprolyl isomerase [Candidatus Cloacimonas sp.]